jgi:hypothetical protein
VKFPEISTPILERVCQYFYYKLRYQNSYVPNARPVHVGFASGHHQSP